MNDSWLFDRDTIKKAGFGADEKHTFRSYMDRLGRRVALQVEAMVREGMRRGLPLCYMLVVEVPNPTDYRTVYFLRIEVRPGDHHAAPIGCLEAGLTMQGLIPFIEAADDQLAAWAKDDPPLYEADLRRLFAHLPAEKWIEPTWLPADPD